MRAQGELEIAAKTLPKIAETGKTAEGAAAIINPLIKGEQTLKALREMQNAGAAGKTAQGFDRRVPSVYATPEFQKIIHEKASKENAVKRAMLNMRDGDGTFTSGGFAVRDGKNVWGVNAYGHTGDDKFFTVYGHKELFKSKIVFGGTHSVNALPVSIFKLPPEAAAQTCSLPLTSEEPKPGDKLTFYGFPHGEFQKIENVTVLEVTPLKIITTYNFDCGSSVGACGGALLDGRGFVVGFHFDSDPMTGKAYAVNAQRLRDASFYARTGVAPAYDLMFSGGVIGKLKLTERIEGYYEMDAETDQAISFVKSPRTDIINFEKRVDLDPGTYARLEIVDDAQNTRREIDYLKPVKISSASVQLKAVRVGKRAVWKLADENGKTVLFAKYMHPRAVQNLQRLHDLKLAEKYKDVEIRVMKLSPLKFKSLPKSLQEQMAEDFKAILQDPSHSSYRHDMEDFIPVLLEPEDLSGLTAFEDMNSAEGKAVFLKNKIKDREWQTFVDFIKDMNGHDIEHFDLINNTYFGVGGNKKIFDLIDFEYSDHWADRSRDINELQTMEEDLESFGLKEGLTETNYEFTAPVPLSAEQLQKQAAVKISWYDVHNTLVGVTDGTVVLKYGKPLVISKDKPARQGCKPFLKNSRRNVDEAEYFVEPDGSVTFTPEDPDYFFEKIIPIK